MSIDPSNTFFNSDQEFLFQQFASSDNPAESYNPAEEVAFAMLFNSSCSSPSPNPTPFNLFYSAPPSNPLPPLQLVHSSSLFGAQENDAASSSILELPPAPESFNPFEMQENGAASSSISEPPPASESSNPSEMQKNDVASSSNLDPKMRKCVNAQRKKCGPTPIWYTCSGGWLCVSCYKKTPRPGKCANPDCGIEAACAWRTNPDDDTTQLCRTCYEKTPKAGKCANPVCGADKSTKWCTHPDDKTVVVCRNCWRALRSARGLIR